MNLSVKFQNNEFVRDKVSRKSIKRTFLSSDPLRDDFFKHRFKAIRSVMGLPSVL